MAKIIHRPKPDIVVTPEYNKVLQNLQPGQQTALQARAEQEQARSRFELALQKAAGKAEQTPSNRSSTRYPGNDRSNVATTRTMERNATGSSAHRGQEPGSEQKQTQVNGQPGQQEPISSVTRPLKKSAENTRGGEVNARQVQESNLPQATAGSARHNTLFKAVKSAEEDNTGETGLENLACPSPLQAPVGPQEPLASGIEVAPTAGADSFSQFETIESMLSHLSLMTARYGPRDWTFEIQNEKSALVSVSLAPAAKGGWDVAITARPENQPDAQHYLDELEAKLEDTELVSLNLKDQDQSADHLQEYT